MDNAHRKGVEEAFKCYNNFRDQSQVRFLFVCRDIELGLVSSLLPHDDQKEINTALTSMEKMRYNLLRKMVIDLSKKLIRYLSYI